MKKYIIVVIAILVVLGGIVVNYYISNKSPETEEWGAYINWEHGFLIEHPKGWSVIEIESENRFSVVNMPEQKVEELLRKAKEEGKAPEIEGQIYNLHIKVVEESIDSWLENQQILSGQLGIDVSKTRILININSAYKIDSKTSDGLESTSRVLFKNEKVYLIEAFQPKECIVGEWLGKCQIFNEILSTFRFLG